MSPSSSLNLKTPPNYSGLKVFGCLALAHVKQDKLDARANSCVFLGYPPGVKGFKLWCIDKKKCIISRDVTFNEMIMPLKPKDNTIEFQMEQQLRKVSNSGKTQLRWSNIQEMNYTLHQRSLLLGFLITLIVYLSMEMRMLQIEIYLLIN